jgi:hypothetical protein
MDLTLNIAVFKLCDLCGNHGHIAYPNGEKSKECATKRQAREMVNVMNGITLDDAEAKALIEMINATNLIESDPGMEKFIDHMTEMLDKVRSGCRFRG